MKKAILFQFDVDKVNKQIRIARYFNAPADLLWAALDQWWAPKPYRSVTREMDFREGGRWLYCMISPDDEKQWCIFEYKQIRPMQHYSGTDACCDENAVPDNTKPGIRWANDFLPKNDSNIPPHTHHRALYLHSLTLSIPACRHLYAYSSCYSAA